MKILVGNGCKELGENICHWLKISPMNMECSTFSDGEIRVELFDHIRGEHVFIIQSTGSPSNHNIMELFILVDAVRRSGATKITAVVPYYGYARQDRRPKTTRTPITSRLIADLIEKSGVDEIVTVDIHSAQQQGFFTIPMINISAFPVIVADIFKKYSRNNFCIVSPDAGGVERCRTIAKQINANIAIIDKRRQQANQSEVMHVIGDVNQTTCIMIDDMVDTAGTLCKGAQALIDNGATKVIAYCTHPVLSGNAIENIDDSVLEELVITDTNPLSLNANECEKIRVISMASLMGETLYRLNNDQSIGAIYVND